MMKLLALLTVFLLSPLTFKAPVTQNLKLEKSQDIIKDKATYIVSKPFDKTINTFEVSIVLPKDIISSEPLGVIFGNYYNSSFGYDGSVDYLIDRNGNFRLYYNRVSGYKAEVDHVFKNYDFRTGKEEHIALTRDAENNLFSLYVNGELVETYESASSEAFNLMRYQIGSDWSNWTKNIDGQNSRYPFKGKIKNVSILSLIHI